MNITVLTINQAVSYCVVWILTVDSPCNMSLSQLKDREMFCRFVLCSFTENLAVTWLSWWIMPEKTGYAIKKFDDDIERVLQENASCFIHSWNLTTMYENSIISNQHCTCIALILVTQAIQTGWWILHPGQPGWSPRLGNPSFTGLSNSQFVIFF